jgi:hypothetical protein
MKTTSGKVKGGGKSKLPPVFAALITSLSDDELRSLRAAINNKLRKVKGGGRPRKNEPGVNKNN